MTNFKIHVDKPSIYSPNPDIEEYESLEEISLYINKANGNVPETVDIYQNGKEIVARAYLPELIAIIRRNS